MAIQQPSPQSSPKRINTYKLAELERRIETLEARRDEFLQLLSQGSDDYTQLMEWQSELEAVEAERERLYLEWLEMQEG